MIPIRCMTRTEVDNAAVFLEQNGENGCFIAVAPSELHGAFEYFGETFFIHSIQAKYVVSHYETGLRIGLLSDTVDEALFTAECRLKACGETRFRKLLSAGCSRVAVGRRP